MFFSKSVTENCIIYDTILLVYNDSCQSTEKDRLGTSTDGDLIRGSLGLGHDLSELLEMN